MTDLTARVRAVRNRFEGPNTIGNSTPFWAAFWLAVAALVAYPLVAGRFAVNNAALFLTLALLGVSLSVIWGYCGILSFGQVAFFGVAGYTFGIVAINVSTPAGITLAAVVGIAVATAFAAGLGYFMFYGGVRDVYVTILTLVVALVLHTFMAQTAGSEWTIGEAALGGFNGMVGIPDLTIGVGPAAIAFGDAAFYYLALALVVGTYLGLRALLNSPFGYAMVAIREDEDRTAMFGYDVRWLKLVVFTFGGALAGLSGVLYASWGNYMYPNVFGITFAALPVVWVSVGGRKSLLGAIVATAAVEWLRLQLALTGSEYALVIVGALLLCVILVLPEGVVPHVHDAVTARIDDDQTDPAPAPEPEPEVSD